MTSQSKKKKKPGKYQKRKGSQWERDASKILTELLPGSVWKRVAGSGAIGTIMGEPLLAGDISGYIPSIGRTFRAEAKVGYGGAKQLAVKREWLEKIREEATGTQSIPMLICKFSGAHGTSKQFVAFDFQAFAELIEQVDKIYKSEVVLLEEIQRLKEGRLIR